MRTEKIFLNGRKTEDQGFGIAAFTYYRRVVENQKNLIIEKIIEVCKKTDNAQDIIDGLEKAKEEISFKRSVEEIKDLLPSSLYISGHNPLTLLHNELSKGIHDKTDEECLSIAKHVRIILTKLIENMNAIVQESKELNDSLSEIFNNKDG